MTEIIFTDAMTVELVKTDIDDETVLHAARVSTKGEMGDNLTWTDRDYGLLRYLWREGHVSPFAHGHATFYVKCPIFVAREFMRHSSWDFNETSGRYKDLEPEFYVPNAGRPLVQTGKVGAYKHEAGSEHQFLSLEHNFKAVYNAAYGAYVRLLEEGVAREVARDVLPVGIYTSFYASASLRSILHFLDQRTAENALHEIRDVANQIAAMMRMLCPRTMIVWGDNNSS